MSTREDPEFNRVTGKWEYEDEAGQTFEKDPDTGKWIVVIDEEQLKSQQAAYAVPGVDESAPAVAPKKKRKLQETFTSAPGDGEDASHTPAAGKKEKPLHKPKETAVYVQNLPLDTEVEELAALFSKCGLLSEDPLTGKPRIKIYTDSEGKQKGDALVIYFREESVSLAVQMLDDTSLRGDQKLLKVSKASFSHKQAQNEDPNKKPRNEALKKKATHRAGKLKSKLEDWSDDDTLLEAPRPTKYAKIVILKGMFSLEELESDPALLLDLKEEVRDECARLGQVTNVVLYDLEAAGVISVRFKDEESAQECLKLMNGRYFGGRQVQADLFDGKTRYMKTGKNAGGEDEDEDEEQRLEKFGAWLEGEE